MRIKRIILNNIRSYHNGEINFPKGSILLSGNIGSGKSSILLSIEFALFGVMRSGLSGASLLRNGEDKGSVCLFMEVDGKEVEIFRSLKRTSTSVAQDSGYITIDGMKKEGTAVELKQAVINLLNYPQDLLTKSKSLIYRYTVYTPQEEMKAILLGNKEDRLETLRKVFGIDKYKRIANNAKIIASSLKEKKKELSGMISDLNEKIMLKTEKEKAVEAYGKELNEFILPLERIADDIEKAKENLKVMEEGIEKSRQIKNRMNLLDQKLENAISRKSSVSQNIESLGSEIKALDSKVVDFNSSNLQQSIPEKEECLNRAEAQLKDERDRLQELRTRKSLSESMITKIKSIDNCPTCYQAVESSHKSRVISNENSRIATLDQNINVVSQEISVREKLIKSLKADIEKLRSSIHANELAKLNLDRLKEKEKRIEELRAEETALKKAIGEINLEKNELFALLEKFDMEKAYKEAREGLDLLLEKKNALEIKKVEMQTKIKSLNEVISDLSKEIQKKTLDRKKLEYVNSMLDWIDNHFIHMMLSMEKDIMLKVHSDFSALFEKWFDTLIDTEIINARIDESFSPVIEQNNYEIDYEYMSGGEKTAAALAYRLALNQVINNLMSTIRTSDIVILDEPTDGFSHEELDKLKLLFEELDMGQLIIVSHEQKIESFVDNVIRLQKTGHITQIAEQ